MGQSHSDWYREMPCTRALVAAVCSAITPLRNFRGGSFKLCVRCCLVSRPQRTHCHIQSLFRGTVLFSKHRENIKTVPQPPYTTAHRRFSSFLPFSVPPASGPTAGFFLALLTEHRLPGLLGALFSLRFPPLPLPEDSGSFSQGIYCYYCSWPPSLQTAWLFIGNICPLLRCARLMNGAGWPQASGL